MLAHQLRWQQQQQPFALITWCWMQYFVAVEQQCLHVGWVGNEEGFIEWRARRAGDDFFGPLDFGAGSPGPHETRHCGGTMETDVGAQTMWLLESMHLGGGGGVGRWRGGDRLSSEKLAEVGRGDGWGESARRCYGKMKSTSPSRSPRSRTNPFWRHHACPLRVKRMPSSALPSPRHLEDRTTANKCCLLCAFVLIFMRFCPKTRKPGP